MKRTCNKCEIKISLSNFKRHNESCDGTGPKGKKNKNKRAEKSSVKTQRSCIFCKKEMFVTTDGNSCHLSHCKEYRQIKNMGGRVDSFKHSRGKITPKRIEQFKRRQAASVIACELLYGPGGYFPNVLSKLPKSKESIKKQSDTRKRKIASGEIVLASVGGRGKCSKFKYRGREFTFRSRYEFVFALWLAENDKLFNYENIKVQWNGHTKINDFEVNGEIFEIKGFVGPDVVDTIIAFENNNYVIKTVFKYEINEKKNWLICQGYDMKAMLTKIKNDYDSGTLFIFDCDTMLIKNQPINNADKSI